MIKIRNKILIVFAVGLIAKISQADTSSNEQGWINRIANSMVHSIDHIVSQISDTLFDSPEEIKAKLRKQCHEEINFFIKQREILSCHIQVFDKYTRGGTINKTQTYPSKNMILRISSRSFEKSRINKCEELEEFLDNEFKSRVQTFWDKKDSGQTIIISDIMPNNQNFPPPRCAVEFKMPIDIQPAVSPKVHSKSPTGTR